MSVHCCICQASRHDLINNCLHCGRVVCSKEGSGPCYFCGELVCTKEELEILSRGSKKSDRLREYLMVYRQGFSEALQEDALDQATQHKNRLIAYDKASVSRTKVIDDEADYYSVDNNWLCQKERLLAQQKEEANQFQRHATHRERKILLDLSGRDVSARHSSTQQLEAPLVSDVIKAPFKETLTSNRDSGSMLHFVPDISTVSSEVHSMPGTHFSQSSRLQDSQLHSLADAGVCLSLHQPWASLLVSGLKLHEGRTWYSSHRGRLWIASTVKKLCQQDLDFVKHHYAESAVLPMQYPTGCLVGCVDVIEVLSQEVYREQFPEGESLSPFVFICDQPQELLVKFPIKGQHKLYKLAKDILKAATMSLK